MNPKSLRKIGTPKDVLAPKGLSSGTPIGVMASIATCSKHERQKICHAKAANEDSPNHQGAKIIAATQTHQVWVRVR